eukprot:CAMPEP_0119047308 /NCGR_PEP_ID=MMETSP1177-20130426/52394_1 /TAXON_ID=2985 /ORGANISM="Ochromonas sp, Strain CCMP1899" /LENGTH=107 /DNA_ID=CAMNT_0007021741 /DNA_START=141 /DNA_END=461 /DNA_ORIENTATION=+
MAEEYGPQTEAALRTFADVKHGFEVNKSLGYDAANLSLKAAHSILNVPEVVYPFLDEYLLKMIGILVNQSPSKLGPYEKKLIEECLLYALVIVIKTLPERPNYIQVW